MTHEMKPRELVYYGPEEVTPLIDAYDELARKLEVAKAMLAAEQERLHDQDTNCAVLSEKLEIAKRALEFYANEATKYRDHWETEQLFDDDCGQIAQDALKEIEK